MTYGRRPWEEERPRLVRKDPRSTALFGRPRFTLDYNTRHHDVDDDDTTLSFYLTLAALGHASNMPITAAPHGRTLTALHMLSSYLESTENKEQIYSTC
jgi:hypothetical protein